MYLNYTLFSLLVYLWRIHFDIWQNQYNIVKLKNKIKKKIIGDIFILCHQFSYSHRLPSYLSYCIWDHSFFCLTESLRVSNQRRRWNPTPVLLPGKSHGRRSLAGCSPWGRSALDTTERLHFHFSPSCTGEGNGNPLQYSCLENPRDKGAWWAAVYGVAQSQTRLK